MQTSSEIIDLDVLTVGHACYDLIFSVDHHPRIDEKIFVDGYAQCGGGPAANAAITVARLGFRSGFCGFLGNDSFGDLHVHEFDQDHVLTHWLVRGDRPTPISSVLVKPDGTRTVINSSGNRILVQPEEICLSNCRPKVILFDGHEPDLSPAILNFAKERKIPTVMDAGSLHPGTAYLKDNIDYLVASRRFAEDASGDKNPEKALEKLNKFAPVVVITLGNEGLVWYYKGETGQLDAFPVQTIDGTGAGDAFHGAFAAGLSANMEWQDLLEFASGAAALTCTKLGARSAIPNKEKLQAFLKTHQSL